MADGTISAQAEPVARRFHEVYEDLAPTFQYRTRPESAVAWEDVPSANRDLMVATVHEVLGSPGVVYCWEQSGDFTACDRMANHQGGHSWELE